MTRHSSFSACLAFTLGLAGLTSCTDVERMENVSDATLQGTVTFQGRPVPHAYVIVATESRSATGAVADDGTYRVERVPLGDVRIAVSTDESRSLMMQAAEAKRHPNEKPTEFVGIPKKYQDPATSEITTSIKNGANRFDIGINEPFPDGDGGPAPNPAE